jgi:hypothetical protein
VHPLTALSEYRLAHHRIRRDARRSCVRTFPIFNHLQSLQLWHPGCFSPVIERRHFGGWLWHR